MNCNNGFLRMASCDFYNEYIHTPPYNSVATCTNKQIDIISGFLKSVAHTTKLLEHATPTAQVLYGHITGKIHSMAL